MKVFIKTFGCELNRADTEVLRGMLVSEGFELVDTVSKADIVIVNSCGVKLPTQNKVLNYIQKIPSGKKKVVGGCLPKMLDIKNYVDIDLVFDNNSVCDIASVLKENKDFLSDEKENRLNKPIVRLSDCIAIVPIAQGCLGECSYCSVKNARGVLKSYAKEDILKAVRKAVDEGCKEIRLTAQDTGCYGKDIEENLPDLLKDVLKIEGDFKIRLGMSNPNYILGYLDEMIDVYKDEKMKKFLHIPLQSGSDKVLKDMERKYSVKDFKKIVESFRANISRINIATDVIIGFPTETDEDFKKTVKFVKEINPEVLNISKYGARPDTEAADMKQIASKEIKRRSVIMHDFWKNI